MNRQATSEMLKVLSDFDVHHQFNLIFNEQKSKETKDDKSPSGYGQRNQFTQEQGIESCNSKP